MMHQKQPEVYPLESSS